MNDFLEMQVFFFVTTTVVILMGVFLVLILIKVLEILTHIQKITKDVSEESALLRRDIQEARLNIMAEGFKLKHILSFFRGTAKHLFGTETKRKTKKTE